MMSMLEPSCFSHRGIMSSYNTPLVFPNQLVTLCSGTLVIMDKVGIWGLRASIVGAVHSDVSHSHFIL